MSLVGRPRSFRKKFLFDVEIPGIGWTGFQKCSEIKSTTAVVEQWEGGGILSWRVAYDSPGRVKVADVTLERGATADLDLWEWYRQVNDGSSGEGLLDDRYKRLVNVVERDRDGAALRRWELHNAWPIEYSAGDRDNTADGNAIESLVLAYDYFDPDDDESAPP